MCIYIYTTSNVEFYVPRLHHPFSSNASGQDVVWGKWQSSGLLKSNFLAAQSSDLRQIIETCWFEMFNFLNFHKSYSCSMLFCYFLHMFAILNEFLNLIGYSAISTCVRTSLAQVRALSSWHSRLLCGPRQGRPHRLHQKLRQLVCNINICKKQEWERGKLENVWTCFI